MKMFMEEFKVLDMSELIAVNGGYSSYSGYSSGSYGTLASGYGTTVSTTGHSVVPVGYVPGKGWLPGYGPTPTPKTDEKDKNDSNSGDNTPSGDTNTKPVNPLGAGCSITGGFGSAYDADKDEIDDLHTGVDMTSATREVSSVKSGTVMFAGKHPDGTGTATGTLVIIKYDDGNYGLYGHMDPNDLNGLKAGQSVSSGSSLGKYYDGKMGMSTGGHLHYSEFSGNTTATGDALARLFNRTGYFYGADAKSSITDPTGQELWNGFTVVNPGF